MKHILIILALVLIFVFYKRKKNSFQTGSSGNGFINDSVLQLGSTGLDVRRLQLKLNELVTKSLNEQIPVSYSMDGHNYIPVTQPLIVDGIFGKATQAMLYAVCAKATVKASEIDSLSIAPFGG